MHGMGKTKMKKHRKNNNFKGKNEEDFSDAESLDVKEEKNVVKDTFDDDLEEEEELPKWYHQFKESEIKYEPLPEDEIVSLKIEAQTILDGETKFFTSKHSKSKDSNSQWIRTVLTKGTAFDKVAAHILTIQNSPIHNVSHISTLISMVKASKKKECILVMDNLADLFLEDLLKPGVKLKPFEKQPLAGLNDLTSGCAKARRLRLAAWMFENKLKDLYSQFIQALDNVGKDTVEENRFKAVTVMNKLLVGHPEQEQSLLKNIINKLGDPNQKVVSKVMYSLTQLLRVHPNMKQIVLDEIEKLLFRPNLNTRTQYYCICCLSQFIFQNKDQEIARNIINIYFSFFKAAIKNGEVNSRLIGALLMGVRRAHPFAKLKDDSLIVHVNTLYKLVHLSTFNIALFALCLLNEISSSSDDRFYSALYRKLLDPVFGTSSHQPRFINLLYTALLKDSNQDRLKAFIKRIFQVCLYSKVPLCCGLLVMVSHLLAKKKHLLITSLKIQETAIELEDDDDEEEVYKDADKEEIKEDNPDNEDKKYIKGWVYCNKPKPEPETSYKATARNPAFANADKSAHTELVLLTNHFHPTVSLFAKKILNSENVVYTGDPLRDFVLVRFLERYVFKNPKNLNEDGLTKGPDPLLAQRKYYNPTGAKSLNVTSSDYLSQSEKEVPVDELFLYNYLKSKNYINHKKPDFDDDNDSVASDEFEDMITSMIGKKNGIDFMDEIGNNLKKKPKVEEDGSSEEEISEDDDEDDISDDNEVIDFGSENEFEGELDLDEALDPKPKKKNVKTIKGYTTKMGGKGLDGLFAPAEEFAEMLEETGSSGKQGMFNAIKNDDNAASKQLDWEKNRDRWIRGENKPQKRKFKGSKKHFTKKAKK